VPYTGIAPLEITLDTCGPMTANVQRRARDGIQMSSVAAASTMPVTNAVAQANIRKSFRILIIAAPCGHGTSVSTADLARAVVGNDGDTSNRLRNA
jgi:hypothetical protein